MELLLILLGMIPVERFYFLKKKKNQQNYQLEVMPEYLQWSNVCRDFSFKYSNFSLSVKVKESIPRQIDKKFRVTKEEKGVWGSQSGNGSGILKEEERTNFFLSTFLSHSQLHNSVKTLC